MTISELLVNPLELQQSKKASAQSPAREGSHPYLLEKELLVHFAQNMDKSLSKSEQKIKPRIQSKKVKRRRVYQTIEWKIPEGVLDLKNVNKEMDSLGRTQLHLYCSLEDSKEELKALLNHGANPNILDRSRWSPLHVACFFGNEEGAALLLASGADVEAKIPETQDTPLHLACEGGFKEVVIQLLRFNPKLAVKNKENQLASELVPNGLKSPFRELFALHEEIFAKDKHGQTQLHKAAASGNKERVLYFLNKGADVNIRDNAGWTPLHEAALAGHPEILALLIQHGGDVNARGLNNDTALHDACENEHLDVVKVLLAHGASPLTENSKKQTPFDVTEDSEILELLTAATKKSGSTSKASSMTTSAATAGSGQQSREEKKLARLLESLVKREEDKPRRKLSRTSLEPEGMEKDKPVEDPKPKLDKSKLPKSKLRDSTPEPGKLSKEKEKEKEKEPEERLAPRSVKQENPEKASKNEVAKGSGSPLRKMEEDPEGSPQFKKRRTDQPPALFPAPSPSPAPLSIFDQRDKHGRTIAHKAALGGDVAILKKYFDAGFDLNVPDNGGWTPLHKAALNGKLEACRFLLLNGASVGSKAKNLDTPLHDAVENQHIEIVLSLLQSGACSSEKNEEGKTPMDVCDDPQIKKLLKGALDLNKQDYTGKTALHRACASGDLKLVKKLTEEGASAVLGDYAGWTPLHEACLKGFTPIVTYLLSLGVSTNQFAKNLDTPLHDASENGHLDVVRVLIKAGADVFAKNNEGNTPLEVTEDDEIASLIANAQKKREKKLKAANEEVEATANSAQTIEKAATPEGDSGAQNVESEEPPKKLRNLKRGRPSKNQLQDPEKKAAQQPTPMETEASEVPKAPVPEEKPARKQQKKKIGFAGYQRFDVLIEKENASSQQLESQPNTPAEACPPFSKTSNPSSPSSPSKSPLHLSHEPLSSRSPSPIPSHLVPQHSATPLSSSSSSTTPFLSSLVVTPAAPAPLPAAGDLVERPHDSFHGPSNGSPSSSDSDSASSPLHFLSPNGDFLRTSGGAQGEPQRSSPKRSPSPNLPAELPHPSEVIRLQGIPREAAQSLDPILPIFTISLIADSSPSREETVGGRFVLDIQTSLLLLSNFDSEALFDRYPSLLARRRLLQPDERKMLQLHRPELFSAGLLELMKEVEMINLLPIGDVVAIVRKDFRHLQPKLQNAIPVGLDLSASFIRGFLESHQRLQQASEAERPPIPPKMALKMRHKTLS